MYLTKTKSFRARIVFLLTLALLALFAVTPRGYAQSAETAPQTFPYKKTFIVSSYYSPLPNQSFYFRGTYEADVRLNGRGTNGADGTQVYPGMAAAPHTFPFGTKLDIPGFGVVAVHDRGGAIKNSRLDIWVGEGEPGLRRALGWGMRTLEVTVYGVDPSIPESVNFDSIPLANLGNILPRTQHFKTDLGLEDSGEAVQELQRFLKKLGYFTGEVTGYFGEETASAVSAFQLELGIIADAQDSASGNFGPKSRVALEGLLEEKKQQALAGLPAETLGPGSSGETVLALQKILGEFGFLPCRGEPAPSGEVCPSGKFDDATREALIRLQIDLGVIASSADNGAGFYGTKTKAALQELVKGAYTPVLGKLISPALQKPLPALAFSNSLKQNDRGENVLALQEELRRLNFLSLEPTGYYGAITQHAVTKFQQAMGIVEDLSSDGAGVVGPRTLAKLNEISSGRKERRTLIAKVTEDKEIFAERLKEERTLLAGALPSIAFDADLMYGESGQDVEQLQKILKRLSFFPGRLTTEYFGDITKQSLLNFQKSHGLAETGVLDDSTRRILNQIAGTA